MHQIIAISLEQFFENVKFLEIWAEYQLSEG